MAKKEGKGKRKGKAKKIAKEAKEKKPKKPTEKERFEMEIEGLKQRLQVTDEHYERLKEATRETKRLLEAEVDDKGACVSYLKRVLRANHDKRTEFQERLQAQQDMAELAEKRVMEKVGVCVESSQASKSRFLQLKMELEGRLSLLEEVRLERNSKRAHLKRLRQALEETILAKQQKSREEDTKQMDLLIRNKEEFVRNCQEVRSDWQRAIGLKMPIDAQKELEENIRLQKARDKIAEGLLKAQDKCRSLKNKLKVLELKEGIQTADEEDSMRRKRLQERRLKSLLRVQEELREEGERPSSPGSKLPRRKHPGLRDDREDLQDAVDRASKKTSPEFEDDVRSDDREARQRTDEKSSRSVSIPRLERIETSNENEGFRDLGERRQTTAAIFEDVEDTPLTLFEDALPSKSEKDVRATRQTSDPADPAEVGIPFFEQDGRPPGDVIDRNLAIIREGEEEWCRLTDERYQMDAILEDQEGHRRSLERRIEESVDGSGAMMSAILRAGKIFQTRCGKLGRERRAELDFDLLQQMRLLLDMT